jgi:hypothetical protein
MSRTQTDQWQEAIEAGLETGQTPWLDLGVEQEVIAGLGELTAVHQLAGERQDVTAPVLVSSGNSLLWLATLLHQRPAPVPARSPNLTVLYGGPDPATHVASLATGERVQRLPAQHATGEGLASFLPFGAHPDRSIITYGETLFWQGLGAQRLVGQRLAAVGPGGEDSWLTWSAILLLFLLILLAVVF